jgi:hypothetical protein
LSGARKPLSSLLFGEEGASNGDGYFGQLRAYEALCATGDVVAHLLRHVGDGPDVGQLHRKVYDSLHLADFEESPRGPFALPVTMSKSSPTVGELTPSIFTPRLVFTSVTTVLADAGDHEVVYGHRPPVCLERAPLPAPATFYSFSCLS